MRDPQKILEGLKKAGHRMTKVRRSMVELLCKAEIPVPVTELISSLNGRSLAVNKTTVYRELEFLLKQKVLREVDLMDGKKRYELLIENDHHHHMICTSCNSIRCVEMCNDLDSLERDILSKFKFRVTSHTLEFFGLCNKCQ